MIEEGEIIYLYHSEKAKYPVVYKKNQFFQSHLGKIVLPENLNWGDVLETNKGYKFFVLKPSIEDLVLNVKRKTNIMYPKDIGYIILNSTIRDGSTVIEVGTGSGAMTSVLAILVGPYGRVYSYDKNEEHLENARKNIQKYGLLGRVVLEVRDVAVNGFSIDNADGCIIDLPEPWTIIPHAKKSLKPGSSVAIVVPTVEQVQLSFKSLKDNGFTRIKSVEILEREIYLREGITRPKERMVSHTVYLVIAYNTNLKV
ncbi:MAG: tRNA (adenine-N1)-methyltransferase [Brevinematales bacterium]|nr:tRNA (adenine-N1)-methyltransferase [Brevinematales bacterium]